MQNLKVYLAAARDLTNGTLADCKIITTDDEKAKELARTYFNDCLDYYEFEVIEQDLDEEEDEVLEEGVYDEAPSNYAYSIFC